MKFSEIHKEFIPYKNQNGMFPYVQNPPAVTQNDTLFTCYAYLALRDSAERDDTFTVFEGGLRDAYTQHITASGAPVRFPLSTEIESNDNLMAWGMMSHYLNPVWAHTILAFARENAWIFPGDNDPFRSWLGRHRAAEAHLMLGTQKETPDYLLQFFWGLSLALGPIKELWKRIKGETVNPDADGFSLSYLMVRLAKDCPRAPIAMKVMASIWWLIYDRGVGMRKNLENNYGWGGSPHAKYIK